MKSKIIMLLIAFSSVFYGHAQEGFEKEAKEYARVLEKELELKQSQFKTVYELFALACKQKEQCETTAVAEETKCQQEIVKMLEGRLSVVLSEQQLKRFKRPEGVYNKVMGSFIKKEKK